MDRVFSIHSSADGQSGCFYVPAPADCAVVSAGMHVSFQITVFSGYMPGSGIAGSRGNCFAGQQGHGDMLGIHPPVLGAGGAFVAEAAAGPITGFVDVPRQCALRQ